MKVSFRLSDADREKFGGDEWVRLDTNKLADIGYDGLVELEKDIKAEGSSLAQILGVEWFGQTMLGIRGMIWLARQQSGLEKPGWPNFKPDILNTFYVIERAESGQAEGGDVDPPAGSSSEQPSAKTATAKSGRSKKD